MRIEYVSGIENYGGFNTYSNNLLKELRKNTLEITNNTTKQFLGVPIFSNKKIKSDITHFTHQEIISPFVIRNKKFVVTVHDLTVKKLNLFDKSNSKFGFLASKLYDFKLSSLKNADKIIAVSQNTKRDIVEELEIDEEKIKVIYEGVNFEFKQVSNSPKIKHSILYVGNELPHKNLSNLLIAVKIVKKTYPDIKLIKVGASGWKCARDNLMKLAKELDILNNIIFKDKVENLTEEYNSAELFVMPSLYEGFGLPVLEAMACGCPVVSSNSSSLPEVGGNSVLYFNPESPEEIAEKIIRVISDDKLKRKMSIDGLCRAKLFTWENCAKQTSEVYFDTQNH